MISERACLRRRDHRQRPPRLYLFDAMRLATFLLDRPLVNQACRPSTRRAQMSAANEPDATNQRAKVAVLSEKVVDTNPYSRLMCAGRHRHACCAAN